MLSGPLAFDIGQIANVIYRWSDGGPWGGGSVGWQVTQVITSDTSDTCLADLGFPDGGSPANETTRIIAAVFNGESGGIVLGTAYASLSETEEQMYFADGGLTVDAFAQVIYVSPTFPNGLVSIGGTMQVGDTSTGLSLSMDSLVFSDLSDASTYELSGNGLPNPGCTFAETLQ
jgi:hypothetical protein